LLVTSTNQFFKIVRIQTNDILFLEDKTFVELEEKELKKAKLTAKPDRDRVQLVQKGQGNRIELINYKSDLFKQDYLEQQTRGIYIATICQPEAVFDLSVAA
jgi:hypothetical protein